MFMAKDNKKELNKFYQIFGEVMRYILKEILLSKMAPLCCRRQENEREPAGENPFYLFCSKIGANCYRRRENEREPTEKILLMLFYNGPCFQGWIHV